MSHQTTETDGFSAPDGAATDSKYDEALDKELDRLERPVPLGPLEIPANVHAMPVASVGLSITLVLVFAASYALKLGTAEGVLAPSVDSLVVMGGLFRPLVQAGEWWRFVTAPFLHGDLVHLGLNLIALFIGGLILEGLVGRAWFLAIYALGAIGGAIGSYLTIPDDLVSVGASGAIMALVAALPIVAHRIPSGPARARVQGMALRILVPSLVPIFSAGASGSVIDYGAHFGGAIVGGLLGLVLLKTWGEGEAPRLPIVGYAIFAVFALATVVGAVLQGSTYASASEEIALIRRQEALAELLVPDVEWSAEPFYDHAVAQLPLWKQEYSRDPRVAWFEAATLIDAGDLEGSEALLRRGLAEREILDVSLPQFRAEMNLMLARVLAYQGRRDEALDLARPLCATSDYYRNELRTDEATSSFCP